MQKKGKSKEQQIKDDKSSKKEEQAPKIEVTESNSFQEEGTNWDDFEEITKGDFKRLLGCG